jgi:hypothetical protein
MTRVYFHCSSTKEVLIDRCGAAVNDLAEARESRGLHRAISYGSTQPRRVAQLAFARKRRSRS